MKTAGNIYVTSKWEPVNYTVKWVFADGSEESKTLAYGSTLTAPENTSKPMDDDNHYSYSWSPAVTSTVIGNATYTEVLTTTAHVYGEWKVNVAPTCTTDGERERVCSVGGETDLEVIPALGHSYEAVVTPPTCTAEGKSAADDGCELTNQKLGEIEVRQYSVMKQLAKRAGLPVEEYDEYIKKVRIRIFGEENYKRFFEEQ